MKTTLFAALLLVWGAASQVYAADAAAGATVFNKCKVCHTINSGGPSKVGPNLFGIVGKKSGQAAGFAYSPAAKAKAGTVVWDEATLDTYLTNPKAFMPGTKMAFVGIKDATERANLIAWLKEQK